LAGGGDGGGGFQDGPGAAARFSYPGGIAVDGDGDVFVADLSNNRIQRVTPADGTVTTVAGSGLWGATDGTGTAVGRCRLNR
jgi:DNA-binding beta-propeller fold protein YncE